MSHVRIHNKSVLEWEIAVGLRYKVYMLELTNFGSLHEFILTQMLSHKIYCLTNDTCANLKAREM